jgi:LemA protein
VESVPSNIIAGFTKIGRADYFEVENAQVRSAPQVSFGQSGPGVSFGQSEPPARPLEPGAPGYGTPE